MARKQGDENLQVRFFKTSEISELLSAKEGKDVLIEIENIQILVPGMSGNAVVNQVNDDYIERFKDEYKAWKSKEASPISGMPLAEWPGASNTLIEALGNIGIRSVEELIAVNEAQVINIAGGATARTRAIAQSEVAANVAEITNAVKERDALQVEVDLLKARIAENEATIAALTADLEKATAPKK
jgi:hypothetical protein